MHFARSVYFDTLFYAVINLFWWRLSGRSYTTEAVPVFLLLPTKHMVAQYKLVES